MASKEHVKDVKESGLSSTTLFVRNLPFVIDSKELENVFSDVGPVKRCFVVKDKGEYHIDKVVIYLPTPHGHSWS